MVIYEKIHHIFCIICILVLICGCQAGRMFDRRNPVILTIWHNYGGQMKNTMDEMIDEFNETVGAEKGIILSVTSISGSATLHEKLIMAADQDPGARICRILQRLTQNSANTCKQGFAGRYWGAVYG